MSLFPKVADTQKVKQCLSKPSLLNDIRKNTYTYLLVLPAVIYSLLFSYLTVPYLFMAFQKFSFKTGLFNSEWVWFENFSFFFKSPRAMSVTINTLWLNFLFIVTGTIVSILLALILNEIRSKLFVKTVQSMLIFPTFLSWIIASYIIYALLSTEYGVLNRFLIGIGFSKINWYSEPGYWPSILSITRIWKNSGINAVVFLAAIAGMGLEPFEAAHIDGASRLQTVLHITIPLLLPTVTILTLMAIGKIFYGDFGMIYAIIRDNGTLYPTTDVIDTYVFRALRKTGDPSQAMAVGLYQSCLGFLMVYGSNLLTKRYFSEGALF